MEIWLSSDSLFTDWIMNENTGDEDNKQYLIQGFPCFKSFYENYLFDQFSLKGLLVLLNQQSLT